LRSNIGPDGRVRNRLQAAVCWRGMQPTLGLLWAEAAGHTRYPATRVNVTDGGHYDNPGPVEARRRGAGNVVVLEASGGNPHTWYTLGGAMALARANAEVDITLDPTAMVGDDESKLARGQVLQPWARDNFTRPDHHAANGREAADGHRLAYRRQAADDHQAA